MSKKNRDRSYTDGNKRCYVCKSCGLYIYEDLAIWRKKKTKHKNICSKCLGERKAAKETRWTVDKGGVMNKLRRWLVHKLGGFIIDGIHYKEIVDDYWDKVHVSKSLYISPSDYTRENAESIERELATQIGAELLRQDCIFFGGPYKDGDELRIRADCPALRIRNRKSYNAPTHLVFKEGEE